MTDNVLYQPPGGGLPVPIAGDSIGGVLHQRVKVTIGADGVNDGDVSAGTPLPVALPASQQTPGGAVLVGNARDSFFTSFFDFDTSPAGDWEVVQTGAGMAITGPLGGGAAGSTPYISIASGTTANERTIILSRATFRAPVEVRYQITASQRIADNAFRIGFVEVDPATGAVLTSTAYAAAPSMLNARNAAMAEWSGITATAGTLLSRSAGSAVATLANAYAAGQTTVAGGTAPNLIPAVTFGVMLDRDRVNARAWAPNTVANTGSQFSLDAVIPNPTKVYKLAIIVENGGVAPASSTDWRLHLVNVLDASRLEVSPRNGGMLDQSKAFPVMVASSVALGTSVSRAGYFAAHGIWYDDSSTALAANATFTGTARDAAAAATASAFSSVSVYAQEVRAMAEADVAGTLWLDASRDGTTWRRVRSVAMVAVAGGGFAAEILYRPAWRWWRIGYTNGPAVQARFTLGSIATAA